MDQFLQLRREQLLRTQNSDGGWGYFVGKKSWLEPTFYASLALNGDPAADKAWQLLRGWQTADGGWKPSADVGDAGWCTALMVTLHVIRSIHDAAFQKGVNWLVATAGAENTLFLRAVHLVRPDINDLDFSLQGWPWFPENASWVEPTTHAVLALKKARPFVSGDAINKRISMGEKMLLDRRCVDGGWNYGNRRVRDTILTSFPETTAIGLLGLQGYPLDAISKSLELAHKFWAEAKPGMARAWLSITLRNYGTLPVGEISGNSLPPDLMVVALEALGSSEGNYRLLHP